jgi:DNA-binding MarR family transcriptional regulator
MIKGLTKWPEESKQQEEVDSMDTLRQLGTFALASRMKRLAERLKAEASKVYRDRGIDFNDSWFLAAWMLSQRDGITASEMAEKLGVSRPAISQMVAGMHGKGLIVYEKDEEDGRRRRISLTRKGRETVTALEPLWNDVSEVTTGVVKETGVDFLGGLAGIEDAFDESSLSERIGERKRR